MSSLVPNADVFEAVMAGKTRIVRRVEIYEADGVTPFNLTPKVRNAGAVTVDASRAERRNVDLTLDNSDGLIDHSPDGLWYDKVVKVYRGVKYSPNRNMRLLFVGSSNIDPLFLLLNTFQELDVTYMETAVLADMLKYDIVAVGLDCMFYGIALDKYHQSGGNIITSHHSLTAGQLNNALFTATNVLNNSTNYSVTKGISDTYFTQDFTPFSYTRIAISQPPGILDLHPLARSAATLSDGTASASAVTIKVDPATGGKWFHSAIQVSAPNATAENRVKQRALYIKAIQWLTPAPDQVWETQIGEFLIDKITSTHFPREIQIQGRDYAKRLMGSKFTDAVSFAAGTSIDVVVKAIATNAGITKFNLNAQNAVLGRTLTFDRTTSRWEAISGICTAASIEVFFDRFGFLVTRPYLDPVSSPISLELSTSSTLGNLVGFTLSSDDTRLYNKVVVTGESQADAANGSIWQGVASNTEPSSPTRISKIGERTYFYTSSFFTSDAQCLLWAQTLLSQVALESFELDFTSLVFFWLEVGEILRFTAPSLSDSQPTRYLLSNISIPLGLESMTGNGKRVTIVGASN